MRSVATIRRGFAGMGVRPAQKSGSLTLVPVLRSQKEKTGTVEGLPIRDAKCVVNIVDHSEPSTSNLDASPPEIDSATAASKNASIRDEYEKAAQAADAKSRGCAPSERVTETLLPYLISRSGLENSLSNTHVTLFNFHNTNFASKIMKLRAGSVILVENALQHAKEAKAFARKKQREGQKVEALRADQAAVFTTGRKRSDSAYRKLLGKTDCDPLVLGTEEDSSGQRPPLLIATFPAPTQQISLLGVLKRSLLTHHCLLAPQRKTLYSYGAVELITFLNTSNFVTIMCGVDPAMEFSSHSHRRASALFAKLFHLHTFVSNETGRYLEFKTNQFLPPILPTRSLAYEKKLNAIGLVNNRVFPVAIRPRAVVRIGENENGHLVAEDVLKYAWFMYTVGRTAAGKTAAQILPSICSELGTEAAREVGGSKRIGTVSAEELDGVFLRIKEKIVVPPEWIKKEALVPA